MYFSTKLLIFIKFAIRNISPKAIVTLVQMLILASTSAEAQMLPHPLLISRKTEEVIYYRACGLFKRNLLSPTSQYIPDKPVCGTPRILDLVANWDRLSKRTKEAFSSIIQRPDATNSITSPEGRFKIHYNLNGVHGVDPADKDQNNIPDYVEVVAKTFDAVWELEINQMGYNPPPSDGDQFYDIYLRELSTKLAYGFVTSDILGKSTASSYMEIDNNFSDIVYPTRGLDGLKVTAAHEFFHAIQFGYYALPEALWWHELTATWIEDVAYNNINDYYQYLTGFFSFPSFSLDAFRTTLGGVRVFGASVFAHYLHHVYGVEAIRKSWEILGKPNEESNSLIRIDLGMPLGGFNGVLPRFAVWNYLTDNRARSGYYPEATNYPSVNHKTVSLSSVKSYSNFGRMDHLGMAYIRVPTSGLSGGLQGSFVFDIDATWLLLVLLISDGVIEILWPENNLVKIPNLHLYNEVVFVPLITSLYGQRLEYNYEISVSPEIQIASDLVGDFNSDMRVNFGDFLTFAEGYIKNPGDIGYNQHLDLNGDGRINLQDFLIFVSHHGESAI